MVERQLMIANNLISFQDRDAASRAEQHREMPKTAWKDMAANTHTNIERKPCSYVVGRGSERKIAKQKAKKRRREEIHFREPFLHARAYDN